MPASIGFAILGVDIKIVDDKGNTCSVNEPMGLVIRGHNVIKGYYTKPEKTKTAFKNDWFNYPKNKSIGETVKSPWLGTFKLSGERKTIYGAEAKRYI
jgi:acyl-CoA synthetase (AMP-forming)/AMP-acid ligase II